MCARVCQSVCTVYVDACVQGRARLCLCVCVCVFARVSVVDGCESIHHSIFMPFIFKHLLILYLST